MIWKAKPRKRVHASGSIYRPVYLLKHTLFAQVFKLLGAGTIPLHSSEWVLRGWHPILSEILKDRSLLLKHHSQALSSCWGHWGKYKILVFGQQQQHLSYEEICVTKEKGVKCKCGARRYPPGQGWWDPPRWLCWVMFASLAVCSVPW